MNGATAEPPPITISTPIKRSTKITGASHHFLRSFIKANRSVRNSIMFNFNEIQNYFFTGQTGLPSQKLWFAYGLNQTVGNHSIDSCARMAVILSNNPLFIFYVFYTIIDRHDGDPF
jgi:hypothetical protein